MLYVCICLIFCPALKVLCLGWLRKSHKVAQFSKIFPCSHLTTEMENPTSQLTQSSNGSWTVWFALPMTEDAKESVLSRPSPRLQATWGNKRSSNLTNSETSRRYVFLTLESVQAIITKVIWKVKSEWCVNLFLRKWKPHYLPIGNWEFVSPFWDIYWYIDSLK